MQSEAKQFGLMARYNRWMNDRLYHVCGLLPVEQRQANVGAYFRSIHGTLNHLLHVDLVWMGRFRGRELTNAVIGEDICASFTELRERRRRLDDDILAWAEKLQPEWLDESFTYVDAADGRFRSAPAWVLVMHLFNHQTHHRGQLTTLLNQLGIDHGITDLPCMPEFEPAPLSACR